jgi:TonB family protein
VGLIVAAAILLAALGGGGYYGYSLWKKNRAAAQQATQSFAPLPDLSTAAEPQNEQNKPSPATASTAQPSGKQSSTAASRMPSQQPPAQAQEPEYEAPPPPEPMAPASTAGTNNSAPAAAVLIKRVQPKYPLLAKMSRVSGVVKLRVVIATDGSVKEVKVISGPRLLTKAATEAVSQWRYKPTLLNGKPTEVVTVTAINFTLGGQQ